LQLAQKVNELQGLTTFKNEQEKKVEDFGATVTQGG